MIYHLTGFQNKYVLAFKRDDHLETSSSVKQKTPRHSALVFSVSRMTSFSVIIPYIEMTTLTVCWVSDVWREKMDRRNGIRWCCHRWGVSSQ